jgi:hypothetical protein
MIISFTEHRPNTFGGYKIPNPIYNTYVKAIAAASLT